MPSGASDRSSAHSLAQVLRDRAHRLCVTLGGAGLDDDLMDDRLGAACHVVRPNGVHAGLGHQVAEAASETVDLREGRLAARQQAEVDDDLGGAARGSGGTRSWCP